jgi:hypothetical protein
MLGLLGLRIVETCGSSIGDLGEEYGHRVLKIRGKDGKVVLAPGWWVCESCTPGSAQEAAPWRGRVG